MIQHTQGSRLEVRGVNKFFGEFCALKDINLTIEPGELVCFLGPSGCGKTTLLRIIAGLEQQSCGTLRQGDVDISQKPPRDRDFGIVFQSYALFPNMTVTDNVAYGLRSIGMPKARVRDRVDELLAVVGLEDHARKYPAQLSGGQQQRVALARALAPSPGLLLLDEPLSALDAKVRHHLRSEIRSLQKQLGVTTIMVTHDQEEALAMADRVVVMNNGVIEQVGTPLDIYQQPASAFVASFIGAMNFFDSAPVNGQRVRLGNRELDLVRPLPATPDGIRLAIRPEDVHLLPQGDGEWEGQVQAMDYLGAFIRTHVRLHGVELDLVVDVDPRSARQLELRVGGAVCLNLPSDALHCFAA
ncbi:MULTISPECIES: putative 2-aminoethylphosphonate ABC transporter ATP-binding protein [Marinobacter]|jgi:iron(III) transport system ATP-binding protein|uniref:Iron(III) transport system ATP-binding protein n=1 Tax=Marinobacter nauticus TaxID=2743 RepID=A0A368VBZ0_MARNT|nr:putative 2-aminoethylphosphonate ABC transporter ATP-binding protein [Marinobacter nauticus]MCG8523471.1 putative 2-aminoethylphosphonate ABC transporter ATP-binding protein [Pseudomonadales bacterium]MBW3196990.1 putative 2-aminoethylphosphonate ABC transporter ATP-binding protein [Marinobacter nauticus]MBY6182400.1 putative 2-aminoethylphosphonate ABC transporter ATP-binding protein [Marinobacter nauticus]RBP76899.1 iron(III) transport system ATP-binding protein [Marinobacter nauticus]RCW